MKSNASKQNKKKTTPKPRGNSPDHVPHEEEEGISGRGAKAFAVDRHLEAECTHYTQITRVRVYIEGTSAATSTTHHDVGVPV